MKAQRARLATATSRIVAAIVCSVLSIPAVTSPAADWPCYRGPNRDGISSESITVWPPQLLWIATNLDEGYSCPVVSGGYVYSVGWEGGKWTPNDTSSLDKVQCFYEDPAVTNHSPIWTTYLQTSGGWSSYFANTAPNDWWGEAGTRSTPAVDGTNLYVFTADGVLCCLDTVHGSVLWTNPVCNQSTCCIYGYGGSPLIEGNLVIVTAGGRGKAIDKNTHLTVWGDDQNTVSAIGSPIAATINGQRTVVVAGTRDTDRMSGGTGTVTGTDPATGNILWWITYVRENPYENVMGDPIVDGNKVWFTGLCIESHCKAYTIDGSGDMTSHLLYANGAVANGCGCSILRNGYIYGIDYGNNKDGGPMYCWTNGGSGAIQWKSPTFGWNENETKFILAKDQFLIAQASDTIPGYPAGTLHLAQASPTAYTEIANTNIAALVHQENLVITPTLANGRLYIKTHQGTMAVFKVGDGSGGSAPVITSGLAASGTVGQAFSYQITAVNSPTNFTATGLPAGLTFSATSGLISGTPTANGSFSVTLSAMNSYGTGTVSLALSIVAGSAPVITSALAANGTVGQAFSYQITASGSPTNYNATGLPSGLTVNRTSGWISGTPATNGIISVTISAMNSFGANSPTLTITINAAAPAPTGLVGWWKLDESSGTTAADSSGNANNGTLNGAPAWQPAGGQLAGALNFNSGDYVDCGAGSSLSTPSVTVAFWMKPSQMAVMGSVDKLPTSAATVGYAVRLRNTGDIWFRLGSEPGTQYDVYGPAHSYTNGVWTHVAGTFDNASGAAKLYVNGVLAAQATYAITLSAAATHLLMARENKNDEPYAGLLDDVRVYDHALTSSEIATVMAGGSGSTTAMDWPCWRGPNKDGRTTESIGVWPPIQIWSTNVGAGYSDVVVSGGRVYTMGNANNMDTLYCFDQTSAGPSPTVKWTASYPCASGYTIGTPTVDGNQVYTLSRDGQLKSFDAATGATNWAVVVTNGMPGYGFASSPLVEGSNVIINAGAAGTAFNKTNGHTNWTSSGAASYASPFAVTIGSQRTVVIYSGSGVYGVDPSNNGNVLWNYPMAGAGVVDPIVFSNTVWASFSDSGAANAAGSVLVNLGSGQLSSTCWTNHTIANSCNPWIYYNGYLYGIGSGGLSCMDAATGTKVWSSADSGATYDGQAGLTLANDQLLVVNDHWTNNYSLDVGDLVVVPATPAGYSEAYRANGVINPANSDCWVAPTLSNGRIYFRTQGGTLVCLSVGGGNIQPPAIEIGHQPSQPGILQLSWSSAAGAHYAVYKTTNLMMGWPDQPLTTISGDGTMKSFCETSGLSRTAYYRLKAVGN